MEHVAGTPVGAHSQLVKDMKHSNTIQNHLHRTQNALVAGLGPAPPDLISQKPRLPGDIPVVGAFCSGQARLIAAICGYTRVEH